MKRSEAEKKMAKMSAEIEKQKLCMQKQEE